MRTILLILFSFTFVKCAILTDMPTDQLPNPDLELPRLSGKKILIVYGGWQGHQPDRFAKLISDWLNLEGAIVTVSDSLKIFEDEAFLKSQDLIIPYWTMGEITEAQEKGLLNAIKSGVGLAGCHGGLGDSFRNNPYYQFMVGGQWVEHPGGKVEHRVQITDKKDAITRGVPDFSIHTEQYYMHVDPNNEVLATTTFDGQTYDWITGATMPVVWKKNYGEGRVFYLSIGHSPTTFKVPEVWTILSRGIRWASGSKYELREPYVSPVY